MSSDPQDTGTPVPPADPSATASSDATASTAVADEAAPATPPVSADEVPADAARPAAATDGAAATAKKIDATTAGGTLPVVGEAAGSDAPAAPAGGGEGDPAPKIDAIICIPGIGSSDGTRFDDVAKRMVTALERCATTGRAVFSVAVRDAKTRDGKSYASLAIRRQDTPKGEPRDVLHLYEYDYRPVLDNGLEKSPPAVQASAIAWTLAFSFPSLWWALFRRQSKDWVQKLQAVYGAVLFGGMAFYLVLLLLGSAAAISTAAGVDTGSLRRAAPGASATAGTQAPPVTQQRSVGPAPATLGPLPRRPPPQPGALTVAWQKVGDAARTAWGFIVDSILWLAAVVIVVPLAGSFVRFNIRETLARTAPTLTTANAYLAAGQRRADLIGGLGDLLNFMDEQAAEGPEYDHVHVAAYSFGSVVAIDALFPHEGEVSRQFQRIQTLVTIGCPYDFVRTYWPKYFQNRYATTAGARPRWINVYSPIDVLGSNFIDEPETGERRKFIAGSPQTRFALRSEWEKEFARGVELMDGSVLRPSLEDNIPFGPGQGGTASFGDWLSFIGFRAHGMYWSRESASAVSCFETVMRRIYAERDPAGALT